MRGPEPALGDGRVRVDGALEDDLLEIGGKHPQDNEEIGVGGGGGDEELQRRRAGDLGLAIERSSEEGEALSHGLEAQRRRTRRLFLVEGGVGGVEIELGPLGACERPLVLLAGDEPVEMAHLQEHARPLVPAVVPAVQKMVEELELQLAAIVGVEVRPVLEPMRLEPFLLGGGAHEALEIAARMQPLAAPVGGREQGHLDLGPVGRALLVILVIEGMLADLGAEIAAIERELRVGQVLRAAHRLAGDAASLAALARAVLHGLHLHVVPVLPERAEDAAVVRHVAIPVGRAFPDAHGGEVGRLQGRHVPLVDGVVGDAVEAYFAARPGLSRRPFDAVVEIPGLARREMIDEPRRAAAAARVDAHAGVGVRHPLLGVDHLPILVFVAGAGCHVRVFLRHALPGARIAVLEGQTLGVGAIGEDDGIAAFLDGAEDIAAQHDAVVHAQGHVPVDAHAVAHLGSAR